MNKKGNIKIGIVLVVIGLMLYFGLFGLGTLTSVNSMPYKQNVTFLGKEFIAGSHQPFGIYEKTYCSPNLGCDYWGKDKYVNTLSDSESIFSVVHENADRDSRVGVPLSLGYTILESKNLNLVPSNLNTLSFELYSDATRNCATRGGIGSAKVYLVSGLSEVELYNFQAQAVAGFQRDSVSMNIELKQTNGKFYLIKNGVSSMVSLDASKTYQLYIMNEAPTGCGGGIEPASGESLQRNIQIKNFNFAQKQETITTTLPSGETITTIVGTPQTTSPAQQNVVIVKGFFQKIWDFIRGIFS